MKSNIVNSTIWDEPISAEIFGQTALSGSKQKEKDCFPSNQVVNSQQLDSYHLATSQILCISNCNGWLLWNQSDLPLSICRIAANTRDTKESNLF